jgi:acyl carrier protein
LNEQDISLRLLKIAAEIFEVDIKHLSLETSAENLEQWDSMAHLNLFIEIQDNFAISFTIYEIQTLKNLDAIVDVIKSKIS